MAFSPNEYFPVEALPTRTTTATGAPTSVPTGSGSSSATTTAASSATTSSKSGLGTGPIVGIAIGAFAVIVLAAALIYMCGRQKTVTEILNRQSMAPSNHNSYQPAVTGVTEAQYPNMLKSPAISDGRFSGYGIPATETESYRSMSPPIDERTSFMGMQQQMHLHQQGLGSVSPGSPGYPSPTYYEAQEMENTHSSTGLRYVCHSHDISTATNQYFSPYQQPASHAQQPSADHGPHEMPVPLENPSVNAVGSDRPFSYTDSEAGFNAHSRRDANP
jgi:hypothetical protein